MRTKSPTVKRYNIVHQYGKQEVIDRLLDRMYRKESNGCGFLRTYSVIHPYFALIQGSSH